MNHELIKKLPDGSSVKIVVSLSVGFSNDVLYRTRVETREKGKRIWKDLVNTDDYNYRKLSMEERVEHINKKNMEVVGAEFLNEAMLCLWNDIKPKLLK